MKNLLFALIGLLFLVSCQESNETKEIVIKNQYSIDLPEFLSVAYDLNDEASLQYQNLYKEFYVIVIDETKQEAYDVINMEELEGAYTADFQGYCDLITDGMLLDLEVNKQSNVLDTNINTLNAKIINYDAVFEGTGIYYSIAYIKGANSFYQVMIWTLSDSKEKYEEKMKKILASFKEI